jgi:alpha-beta hydrolase superfamily lysophospholipase
MSVHRTYRHLAERLAASGIATLRFDYEGTGDSYGTPDLPGRMAAFVRGVRLAADELRARAGATTVTLFGVRFGATIAMLAAEQDADVEGIVAWAPIVSGRQHVREIRAFHALRSARRPTLAGPGPGPGRGQGASDGEEMGGFLFTRETLAEMSAVDLLRPPRQFAPRMLVLSKGAAAPDEQRLADAQRAAGADVRLVPEPSFAGMMRDDPYEVVVPTTALDGIVAWIGEGRGGVLSEPPSRNDEAAPAPVPALATATSMRLAVAVEGGSGTTFVEEMPLRFGPRRELFGVVSAPGERDEHVGARRPAVLLLNVGGNHEVGPHRMNVDLARELASLGYVAFRFDVAGLGDSPVARGAPGARENRIYAKDSVADVQAAMSLLAETRGVERFVLVGLCSGAYLAFHSAVADARVAGQVLVSSYAFEWKEGDPVTPTERKTYDSTRSYLHGILEPKVWLRLLRGEIDVTGIGEVLVTRALAQLEAELPRLVARWRGTVRIGPRNDVERDFVALCERGVESLLVSCFSDGGLDTIARYLGSDARRMRGYDRFALDIVPDADHTFTSLASQRTLSRILRRYLAERFKG